MRVEILHWIWRRKWILLISGIVFMSVLAFGPLLDNYYTYQIRVSFVYPGAENGLYPDGKRFLREDLIDRDRVAEALETIHKKGWFSGITEETLLKSLSVSEYLTSPVQAKVEAMRNEGQEYTYYNNEYIITLRQPTPLHLKDASDFFGLLPENRCKEFLKELFRVNNIAFLREHTEGNSFKEFSEYLDTDGADYDQIADIYEDKATLCSNYLRKKSAESSTFVSKTTGKSFDELIIGYQALIDVQVDRLRKYVTASSLTKVLEERVNLYKVEIENTGITYAQKADEANFAEEAMKIYDHTFSENIIIVSVNEENGLYQARPKTAYDTVTQRAMDASVEASVAKNAVAEYELLLSEYKATMNGDKDKVSEMLDTADSIVKELVSIYESLSAQSALTIQDYIDETNMHYMKSTGFASSVLNMEILLSMMMAFGFGAVVAALFCLANDWRIAGIPNRPHRKER